MFGAFTHLQAGSLRRASIVSVGLVVLGLAGAPGAFAASNEHGSGTATFVDSDFCGTGVAVESSIAETFTLHFGKVFWMTDVSRDVLTNVATGSSVVASSAGLLTGRFSGGDPEGIHTLTFTHSGLTEKIETSSGSVMTRDAGYVVSVVTFDGDQFLGEDNVIRGPHPELESGFALFCEVTSAALDIQ